MQKATNKAKEQKSLRSVHIYNVGEKTYRDAYDGDWYELPPGMYMTVPAAMAWQWFGDPDQRPSKDKKPGDKDFALAADWNREIRRLQNRHGWTSVVGVNDTEKRKVEVSNKESMWAYILEGSLYVEGPGYQGKGKEFYAPIAEQRKIQVIAEAIPEDGERPVSSVGKPASIGAKK